MRGQLAFLCIADRGIVKVPQKAARTRKRGRRTASQGQNGRSAAFRQRFLFFALIVDFPLEDSAVRSVDLAFVFHCAVAHLDLVDPFAVVPVKLAFGDRRARRFFQRDASDCLVDAHSQ